MRNTTDRSRQNRNRERMGRAISKVYRTIEELIDDEFAKTTRELLNREMAALPLAKYNN